MVKEIIIKDSHVPELIEVFSEGYFSQLPDENGELIDNPQTKAQYASEQFDLHVKRCIKKRVQRHRERVAISQVSTEEITEKK